MIRSLAEQNERLRERVVALEELGLGVANVEPEFRLPYEGEELPPADGG